MKILIVDDSRMIRQAIRAVLEALSFEADEAADGQEALQKVTAFPEGYDLILLDWNMPVMDGHDTLRTLQADPNLHRIPVVMVTGFSKDDVPSMDFKEWIQKRTIKPPEAYIEKPVNKEVLLEVIRKSIG